MKIVSKKGIEIEVIVSGFAGRFDSEIKVSFNAGGKVVKNEKASIVRNGKIVEGISIPKLNVYVECEVSEIEKAISALPAPPTITNRMVEIKSSKYVSDGYEMEKETYIIRSYFSDGSEKVNSDPSNPDLPDGRWIYWSVLSDFLKKEKINTIEFDSALALYIEKHPRNFEKEAKAKQGIQNIMLDNESEGVPAGNGIWE